MDVEDEGSNALIFFEARSLFSREVLVISASVDPEEVAESFNVVLEPELVDSV